MLLLPFLHRSGLFLFALGFGTELLAQNLVSNPSFEELYKTNCKWSSVSVPFGACVAFWDSPNAASPDMHSLLVEEDCWSYAVNSQYADSISCQPGSQYPRTGNVMAGFITTNDSTQWREYVRNRMIEAMSPGKLYRVQFYVSLADNSAIASNNIGVYFSEDHFDFESNGPLPFQPQIEVPEIIGNDQDWVEIDTVIAATAPWQFLTIGNFKTNEETDTKFHQYCPWAYYYIDDVSVKLAEDQTIIPNVFTPNGDGMNDTFRPYLFEPNTMDARIYDRWGRLVFTSDELQFDWDGNWKNGTNAAEGVYFYVIRYTDDYDNNYTVKGYVTLIR